jgi:hypothetical protein
MRSFIVGLALLASTPALAIEKQVDDLLRVASAQTAILQFCSTRFQVDKDLSWKTALAAQQTAFTVLGPADGDTELKGELSRRFNEVQAMGEDRWCRAERALYNEQRIPIFKN